MQINSLIRNAIKDKKPRNIIIASYDGLFEYSLAINTPHNYYILENSGVILQCPITHPRIHSLNQNIQMMPIDLDIDLIICNDIISQLSKCMEISRILQVPLLIIHHSIKPPFVKSEDVIILKKDTINHTRISVNSIINNSWYANFPVLPYLIPELKPTTKNKEVLIIGSFNPTQIGIIKNIIAKSNKPITLIGNNPGLSKLENFETCINEILEHKRFINLWNDSDTNQFMLYAMKAGLTILSNPSKLNKSFIKHGEDGYIGRSVDDFIRYINTPLLQPAQITTNFIPEWNELLDKLCHTAYRN